ncbi:hypothetical protein POM88_024441 [Heracleum sosnowskyi]|uniref:Nuclear pore complex protein GP210 C-terminal Ig-like domain-containing protein n=1 Tax=Heracleum sosnowskyi TaxID=360622 RepID=A0AAD8I445_9APIA|nr:hypothetical protein POM88_024441 [Heracleum sosnowskyi]
MKTFQLICYLILLLVSTTESRPAPGREKDTRVLVNASSGTAIFRGGFGVLEMDHTSVRLNLTTHFDKSDVNIVINNTTDVDVRWQGSDQLVIQKERQVGAEYEVRVSSVEGLKDKVIISLAANGERVEIYVNYEFEKRIPLPPPDSYRDIFIKVFCFTLVFLVVFYVPASYSEIKETEQPRSCVTGKE